MQHSRLTSLQSKRFVERKKTRLTVMGVLCLIILGTAAFSAVKLVNLQWFSIQRVYVIGPDQDIAPSLEAAVLDAIQGSYAGLFARSNTFLYPSNAVVRAVLGVSPRIASVSIHRAGLQALAISVTEKAPAAIVCASLPDFSDSSQSPDQSADCYFADGTGYIYGKAPTYSGSVYNRYYAPDLSGDAASTTPIGSFATSTAEFDALQSLFADLKAASIQASAVLIKDGGEYELYAQNPSQTADASSTDGNLTVIYFNDARPFADQMVNLISFWKQMTDTARAKDKPLSFEYIDVRYGSNVFYRLNK